MWKQLKINFLLIKGENMASTKTKSLDKEWEMFIAKTPSLKTKTNKKVKLPKYDEKSIMMHWSNNAS